MKTDGRPRARVLLIPMAAGASVLALAGSAGGHGAGGVTVTINQGSALTKASNGYRVQIFAQPNEARSGSPGLVQVTAFKGQRRLLKLGKAPKPTVSSGYSTQGTVGPSEIKADLGKFGKVNLSFHAKRTTHPKPGGGCSGKLTRKTGVWKGTFRFKGENGYTKVTTTRINGQYETGSLKCTVNPGGPRKKHIVLSASSSPFAKGSASFSATKLKSGGKVDLGASSSESDGAVQIYRAAHVRVDSGKFTYNPGLTHAKVKGVRPFKGAGTFNNGDWTGDLRVKFPGRRMALTGPEFTAQLDEETYKHPTARP